jgi:glycosyltransferase involved in cell wall biosynthesis
LKLAFVTTRGHDARDVRAWSGTPYHMAQALLREGVAVEHVGPLETRFGRLLRARARLQRRFDGAYLWDRAPTVLDHYAHQVESRLSGLDVDAVFSPSTLPVAHLETPLPIVTWTDATFATMLDYYPSFSGLSGESIRAGHAMERAALARIGAALYSSTWAADSAVRDYDADPAKVHVVPFGANLGVEPSRREVEGLIRKRPRRECRLLFIGVDWFRKGGDLALAVASRLADSGIPTKLTVIGCRAPHTPASDLVEGLGFIDKATPSGEAVIGHVLGESHFLCVPSRADCTPVVFCEASAYGLPSVSVRTGGIGSVVKHGENGYLFELEGFVENAVESISRCMAEYDDVYVPLAMASHEEYRLRLNWTASTKTLVEHVSRLVSDRG